MSPTDPFGRPTATQQSPGASTPVSVADTGVPKGPALDDRATRTALTRYRRRGRWISLAGAALLVAFLVVVAIQGEHTKWLLQHGARTPGRITSVSRGAHGGSLSVDYLADGRLWRGTIALTESSGYYAPGESVTVIYDPRHPTDIRTPAEKNEPRSTVLLLILALAAGSILLTGGIGTLVRARRLRRLLANSPWRPYRARYLPRVKRGRLQPLNPGLEVLPVGEAASSGELLRLASTWRWRSERMRKYHGETIWLAGDPEGKVVIGIPATRELLAASAPRRGIAAHYRRAASEPTTRDPASVKKARRTLSMVLIAQWVLFTGAFTWLTRGSSLGLAIVALYTVCVAVTLISLRRAPRNTEDKSTGQ